MVSDKNVNKSFDIYGGNFFNAIDSVNFWVYFDIGGGDHAVIGPDTLYIYIGM